MSNNKTIIPSVKHWLESAVIGLKLCPFAKKIYDNEHIRYAVSESSSIDELILELHDELLFLDENPSTETTLLIIHQQLDDFDSFNQALNHVDDLLEAYDWVGIFQIASFHPQYQFSGTEIDDRENWTNRSPYPILHLLRESSLELVINEYPSIEEIPENNIRTMNTLSTQKLIEIFRLKSND